MRTHGTLVKWNDDRGFGFIAPAGGGAELFVHVSDFPRDGRRPAVGEVVSYETEAGPDGKTRAVKIMRPGQKTRPGRARRNEREEKSPGAIEAVIAVLLLVPLVELLNSAIEALADAVSDEHLPLLGQAKDIGSAAVLVSLAIAALVWCAVLLP